MEENFQNVMFTNWTQEDFTGFWDKKPTLIKTGEMIVLPRYLASHFANHLSDRECNNANKPTIGEFKEECIKKCLSDIGEALQEEIKEKVQEVNKSIMSKIIDKATDIIKSEAKFCEYCDSKGGRHKSDCKRPQEQKDINPNFTE
jgi:hypothetical protein